MFTGLRSYYFYSIRSASGQGTATFACVMKLILDTFVVIMFVVIIGVVIVVDTFHYCSNVLYGCTVLNTFYHFPHLLKSTLK